MVESRCTIVRLPLGHFTLGPAYCDSTSFAGEPAQVYTSAWTHLLTLCQRLHAAGIGVLLDLHAVPGGANTDSHSGTSSGKAALWGSKSNQALTRECHVFMAREIAAGKIPNAIGIELCNEAAWGAADRYKFYEASLTAIAEIDPSIPVYVSDAWNLAEAVQWAAKWNMPFPGRPRNLVVVDTHTYYTFTDADRACTPQQILDRIPGEFQGKCQGTDNVLGRGATPIFIGEYSCVLDGKTWSRVDTSEREGLVRRLGAAQVARAHDHSQSLGAAFWTLKMDWMDGGEWGFVEMTRKGAISAPEGPWVGADQNAALAGDNEQLLNEARDISCQRLTPTFPKVFGAGFDTGWRDALALCGASGALSSTKGSGRLVPGADQIGCRDAWVLKRLREVGSVAGTSDWEQGIRQGIASAEMRLQRNMSR